MASGVSAGLDAGLGGIGAPGSGGYETPGGAGQGLHGFGSVADLLGRVEEATATAPGASPWTPWAPDEAKQAIAREARAEAKNRTKWDYRLDVNKGRISRLVKELRLAAPQERPEGVPAGRDTSNYDSDGIYVFDPTKKHWFKNREGRAAPYSSQEHDLHATGQKFENITGAGYRGNQGFRWMGVWYRDGVPNYWGPTTVENATSFQPPVAPFRTGDAPPWAPESVTTGTPAWLEPIGDEGGFVPTNPEGGGSRGKDAKKRARRRATEALKEGRDLPWEQIPIGEEGPIWQGRSTVGERWNPGDPTRGFKAGGLMPWAQQPTGGGSPAWFPDSPVLLKGAEGGQGDPTMGLQDGSVRDQWNPGDPTRGFQNGPVGVGGNPVGPTRGFQAGGLASLLENAVPGEIPGGMAAAVAGGAGPPGLPVEGFAPDAAVEQRPPPGSEEQETIQVFTEARLALEGNHPDPGRALDRFVEMFGIEALERLKAAMEAMASDGMSDSVPGVIDGREEVALSEGEFVVPADAVSGVGNGSTEAGARRLMDMVDQVRVSRTGMQAQPPEVDPSQMGLGGVVLR